jgi:hypothetical protein
MSLSPHLRTKTDEVSKTFSSYLEFRKMVKVQKPGDSVRRQNIY